MLGTGAEIEQATQTLAEAENARLAALLRLRALKGQALLQSGDSFNVMDLTEHLAKLQNEFGVRNLRVM